MADWRLPTVAELQSLVDFDRAKSALPAALDFAGMATATWAVGPRSVPRWTVEFRHGQTSAAAAGAAYLTRCVRSPAVAPAAFDRWVSVAEFVAKDQLMGLQWLRHQTASTYMLNNAVGWCVQLSQAGSGWRAATIRELLSLVDRSAGPPYADAAVFLQPRAAYWSLTGAATTDGGVFWAVNVDDDSVSALGIETYAGVRCVRPLAGKP